MDRGQSLHAARQYQRLVDQGNRADSWQPQLSLRESICWLRAGQRGKATEALQQLKDSATGDSVPIGGRRVKLFGDKSEAVDWLIATLGPRPQLLRQPTGDWSMAGGDPSRNGVSSGDGPLLHLNWRMGTIGDPSIRANVAGWQKQILESSEVGIPASEPLIVGDVLLTKTFGDERTATGPVLVAVDVNTGQEIWRTVADDTFDPLPVDTPKNGEIRRDTVATQNFSILLRAR